jgi:hypothetical protein
MRWRLYESHENFRDDRTNDPLRSLHHNGDDHRSLPWRRLNGYWGPYGTGKLPGF